MGNKQAKSQNDLLALSVDKQLALLVKALSKPVCAKSISGLDLFIRTYHPQKELMMAEPQFNHQPLIALLVSKYIQFHDPADPQLTVAALTAGVHVLGLLAREDHARYVVIESGAIPLILAAMRTYPQHADLLEFSLFALGNLSLHTMGKTAIMALNGVPLFADLLQHHRDRAHVLERACFTLGNLAYHENCKRTILEANCVQLALDVAPLHGDAPQFLLECCFFLSNMCVVSIGRKVVIERGGLQIVVEAMRRHPHATELLELGGTAIFNMSLDANGKKLIDEMGALEVMVQSIRNNLDSPAYLIDAVGNLGRLFFETDANILKLIRNGVSELVLEAMQRYPDDPVMAGTGANVLDQLAGSVDEIKYEVAATLPSLKELAARAVLNGPPRPLSSLPFDLVSYLQENVHRCSMCGGAWIESHYELVSSQLLHGYDRKLPIFSLLCGPDCAMKMKDHKDPIHFHQKRPILHAHAI